ncbi:MAG TPA: hypothetical protein VN816_09360 [Acidimicrobiales bacterium]|nr:hypothetical protein [Acidimicrobiales bacterium]
MVAMQITVHSALERLMPAMISPRPEVKEESKVPSFRARRWGPRGRLGKVIIPIGCWSLGESKWGPHQLATARGGGMSTTNAVEAEYPHR